MRSIRIRIRIRCSHLSLAAKNLIIIIIIIIIASRFDYRVFVANTTTAKALSYSALSCRLCLAAKKRDIARRMRRRSREAMHRNSWKNAAIFPHNDCLFKEEVKEEEQEEWYSTNEKRKTRRIERKSTTTFPT
jgi:hypothetical protein